MSLANRAPDAAAAAPEYVKHLLAILGDRDPLQVQEQLLSDVREAVAGMDAAAARLPETPGKWAVVEVVQHLADTEMVYGYRMRMILAHQEPEIQGYDQDLWAERLHYREREMTTPSATWPLSAAPTCAFSAASSTWSGDAAASTRSEDPRACAASRS